VFAKVFSFVKCYLAVLDEKICDMNI